MCTKKRSQPLCSGLLSAWSTIAFWIPVKPPYLRNMLRKSMRYAKNSKPTAGPGQQNTPNSSSRQRPTTCSRTNTSKVEQIGLRSLASSTIFTWHLANQPPLLQPSPQLFARKMLPQPAGGRKCFPQVWYIPRHGSLRYRNKQTYFLLAKICWL